MDGAFISSMYGIAVGDAIGIQFKGDSMEELSKNPCDDMVGYGNYFMPSGYWADNTSMAIATLCSLNSAGINTDYTKCNILDFLNTGKYSCGSFRHYRDSVYKYIVEGKNNNNDENDALVRIIPVCIYATWDVIKNKTPIEDVLSYIYSYSEITNKTILSKFACGICFFIVRSCIDYLFKPHDKIKIGLMEADKYYHDLLKLHRINKFDRLFDFEILNSLAECDIKSTSKIVDTLETALWCIIKTDSFEDCVLKAVNLGGDANTVASLTGGIAGLIYGEHNIPFNWRMVLYDWSMIEDVCKVSDERYKVKLYEWER